MGDYFAGPTEDLAYETPLRATAPHGASTTGSFSQSCNTTTAEQELGQLLDSANVIIFEIDPFGRIMRWNAQAAELSGFSSEEALEQHFVKTLVPPHCQAEVEDVMESTFHGRGTCNFELELRAKDGETRYLLVSTTPRRARDGRGGIVGVVVFAQDISESCKHDRAVASMANELRLLIDTANAPIFGIDRDG
jgi:PAS domain S-box-containing protein